MRVYIPKTSLTKCKALVQESRKSKSDFKELGGYLLGLYDGDFIVKDFLLDTNAEATGTRIKLSAECFQRVEEQLAIHPSLFYLGTWHVHPGKIKPTYSNTDESTLFLEKLVIKTDNPKEFLCPRIHLIFSEDLMSISAFTMEINITYLSSDYMEQDRIISDNELEKIDDIIKFLQDTKKQISRYKKNQNSKILDAIFAELGKVRANIDQILDIIEDISDYQEIFKIIQKDQKNIDKRLKSKIRDGASLGLIALDSEEKIALFDYLPDLIEKYSDDGSLLGFWRHYSFENPSIELQEIFYANFYVKIQANPKPSYLYIVSDPTGIKYIDLKLLDFVGISFKEVEIEILEMD